jgi:hypothetical protein
LRAFYEARILEDLPVWNGKSVTVFYRLSVQRNGLLGETEPSLLYRLMKHEYALLMWYGIPKEELINIDMSPELLEAQRTQMQNILL